ncbi:FxsA family protein [Corynebacterium sp. 320]|uniref:FxsA family protein n=1 Tax=Corynebacterium TaxID=1716 RepID=UPI00125CAEBA|nr:MULTISPECIES: FxsA family protein [Corynebacterium]KAB1503620.1 FxsA family protein [Corynebacterium sp. 320]KAB1553279.1 FxsA family protein [Corynebacterium sp. 321]KAB1553502.1 FxsA family protein [Corynebacterium sp. 319]KAB3527756.1 FxsA family protein [Corynebacterium sp. 250]KAB3540755.1 FxsA family protein [Corynebacterium sp. 366]
MPYVPLAYLIVEALAFYLVGKWIGFGWTVLLLVALFVVGMFLAAQQIRAIAVRALNCTEQPGKLTADAALSVVGALAVALPGLVTSVLGVLLLIPTTRAIARRIMGSAARAALARFGGSAFVTATRYGAPEASNRIPGWGEVIDHRDDEFDGNSNTPDRRNDI